MINHTLGRVFNLFNIDFGAVRRWTRRLAWSRTGVNGASPISTAARRSSIASALDALALAEVKRDDVTFARVYDVRGRPTPNLLTEPPS
jgi:hypothetical protein